MYSIMIERVKGIVKIDMNDILKLEMLMIEVIILKCKIEIF